MEPRDDSTGPVQIPGGWRPPWFRRRPQRLGASQPRSLRRVLRRVAGGIALATLAVLLGVFALLLLPPSRNRLLAMALDRAEATLPGTLSVQAARWPALGRIELRDARWIADGELLVAFDTLAVSLDVAALVRRDVHLRRLAVVGLRADIPAIRASLRAARSAQPPAPLETVHPGDVRHRSSFPRSGAIAALPSLAVDDFALAADWLRLADSTTVMAVDLSGGLDLRAGSGPGLRLDRCAASGSPGRWSVSGRELELDLLHERLGGSISGWLTPLWPFELRLASDGPNTARLSITMGSAAPTSRASPTTAATTAAPAAPDTAADAEPAAFRLELSTQIHRDGLRPVALDVEASLAVPGTRTLASLPALAEAMEELPALEGLTASLTGTVQLQPQLHASLQARLRPNAWLRDGLVSASYGNATLQVDTLRLAVPEARLSARGALARGALAAEARLDVQGMQGLRLFAPSLSGPDSLQVDMLLRADGMLPRPDLEATLHGRVRAGSFALAVPHAAVTAPQAGAQPIDLAFRVRAMGLEVDGDAAVILGRQLQVQLAPLQLRVQGGETPPSTESAPKERSGTVRYDTASGVVEAEGLRLTGALGELELATELDRNRQGPFTAQFRWPRLPPLLPGLFTLSTAQWDSLAARWQRDGPFQFDVAGTLDDQDGARRVTATGSFWLPGPRQAAPVLPASARVDDLHGLGGGFDLEWVSAETGPEFTVLLDPSRTPWLRGSPLRLHGQGGAVQLDSLRLGVDGVDVALTARHEGAVWDAAGSVVMSDARLLRRFVPQLALQDSVHLVAESSVRGTVEDLDVRATLRGAAHLGTLVLPRLDAVVSRTDARWSARIEAPSGLSSGDLVLDSLALSYRTPDVATGPPPDSIGGRSLEPFPGDMRLTASGPWLAVRHSARLAHVDGWDVQTDSLFVRVGRRFLQSAAPFRVRVPASTPMLVVDDMRLSGDLGTIELDGFARADSSDLRGDLVLTPAETPSPLLPAGLQRAGGLWPERVEVHIRAHGTRDLEATLSAGDLKIAERPGMQLRADVRGGPAGLAIEAALETEATALISLQGQLPARLAFYPPALAWGTGPMAADVQLVHAPVPWELLPPTPAAVGLATLEGRIRVRGSLDHPWGEADVRLEIPGSADQAALQLAVAALLRGGEAEQDPGPDGRGAMQSAAGGHPGAPSGEVAGSLLAGKPLPELSGAGLALILSLSGQGRVLADGSFALPMSWPESGSGTPRPDPGRPLELRLRSRDFALADLAALMPKKAALSGTLTLELDASGAASDPSVAGRLVGEQLSITSAAGDRAAGRADLKLGGSLRHPAVEGRVEVQSGVISIPERSRTLHPTDGTALLWELRDHASVTASAIGDSAAPAAGDAASAGAVAPPRTPAPGKVTPPTVSSTEQPRADLDVEVVVPSGLWVRGRQLEVELSGQLRVAQKGTQPTVTGELKAQKGTLRLMGRSFDMERGVVRFYGDDETNPALDIELAAKVSSTTVRIHITGTAHQPELELSSEPEMSEGDIMAVLVFGETTDELDGDQSKLIAERAAAIAATYGAQTLESSLSGPLKVDLLSYNPATGEEGEGSVVVGKYLSPKALLKYEQALDATTGFLVTLEYTLTRSFTLETLVGTQQSGAELRWSRDY